MIVCLCFGVSHRALEQLKEEGYETVRQVQSQCQAGSSCGACIPDLKKALKQACSGDSQDSLVNC